MFPKTLENFFRIVPDSPLSLASTFLGISARVCPNSGPYTKKKKKKKKKQLYCSTEDMQMSKGSKLVSQGHPISYHFVIIASTCKISVFRTDEVQFTILLVTDKLPSFVFNAMRFRAVQFTILLVIDKPPSFVFNAMRDCCKRPINGKKAIIYSYFKKRCRKKSKKLKPRPKGNMGFL